MRENFFDIIHIVYHRDNFLSFNRFTDFWMIFAIYLWNYDLKKHIDKLASLKK